MYDVIKDMKKDEVSLRYILSSICYSLSTKNLKSIISALKDKMVEDGLITLENKKGIIGDKEVIKIDEDKFTNIVNEIKTEILEKGNLSEELILLTSLLNSTRFLKNIFSKYEKEKIDDVLKEIENTDIAENVKVAQSAIGTMHAIIVSSMVNATHT